ncbi:MAG: hypothetical protein H7067_13570, partial [Burkholderiales bacterium]|nr:hypothetical protein [Opitutaceae bacterium]
MEEENSKPHSRRCASRHSSLVISNQQPAVARGHSSPQDCGSPVVVLIALHKPYGVLSQFTPEPGSAWKTLADLGAPPYPPGPRLPPRVYPLGRLDADSEGLLLLSDEPGLNTRLLDPSHAHEREYWVQVERIPAASDLERLSAGVLVQGRKTLPCRAWLPEPQPHVPPRDPPIRFRKNVPECWIVLELVEG